MQTSIYFQPALVIGATTLKAQVIVSFDGYDSYSFIVHTLTPGAKAAYRRATKFVRLVERGYAPREARHLCIIDETAKDEFERYYEPSMHDKLTDERVTALPVDEINMMFTDPLTPADEERLYAMWLMDGDEIFHFDPALSELWNIPALLSNFRALAQTEDDPTGDFTHSHHLDLVQY